MKLKRNGIASVYKKHRDKRLIFNVILIVCVLMLSIVLTAAYGNKLKQQAQSFDTSPTPDLPLDTATPVEDGRSTAPKISTAFIEAAALIGETEFAEAVNALPEGFSAVSLPLYTAKDGAIWQASSASLISDAEAASSLTAPAMFAILKENGLYSSAVFESRAFSDSLAPAEKAAIAAYEQLLITELYASGCNEILLHNANATADNVGEITEYCRVLKKLCEGITVGISLARGADVSEDGSVIYNRLAADFDFLCLDLTAALYADIDSTFSPLTPDTESAVGTEEKGDNAADFPTLAETVEYELLHISRYEMRVLFRISENASLEGCATVLLPFLAELSLHSVYLVSEQ